jgi:DnaJ family protein C protein 8
MVGKTATRDSVNYGIKKQEKKNNFPPPIPSLSLRGGDGGPAATLRMKSHRNNGRLVLEAVPVPQQNNNFKAQRQGGRLVLTFAGHDDNNNKNEEEQELIIKKEFEQEFNNFEDDDIESEIDEETGETEFDKEMGCRYVFEETPKSGIMNVHRLALMVNKPMALPNRNPTIWSNKFDVDQDQVKHTPIAQSLPPRPPRLIPSQSPYTAKVAAVPGGGAVSFNAYEYYWRPEPMVEQSPIINDNDIETVSRDEKQKMAILRKNKGDYLVPLSKGCKETRRSLLFWETCCITTS